MAFADRVGVPIVFTWPAGSPGLLGGYQHDRESGEYANLHLKMLLVALASTPKLHKIHIIAHSRGTDVATTAVRELHAEIRAGMGKSFVCDSLGVQREAADGTDVPADPRLPWMPLKLETLVLAAPDLDLEVISQRYMGENLLNCAKRTVIYSSSADQALGLSDWLFNSRSRVGNFSRSDLCPQAIHMAEQMTELEPVTCTVSGGSSHSYVMQHPAALSDLILLLRDGCKPGAGNGRPLKEPHKAFWELDNDYMRLPPTP
jgi:esterase/lipase superfamily enzyme